MNKKLRNTVLVAATALLAFACNKSPFEVASVEVPAGSEFTMCLDESIDTTKTTKYYYTIFFITKDKFRYSRDGVFVPSNSNGNNCYSENKLQYSTVAYEEATIARIQNISNQNIDTCFVKVYKKPELNEEALVFERTFTAEDFK